MGLYFNKKDTLSLISPGRPPGFYGKHWFRPAYSCRVAAVYRYIFGARAAAGLLIRPLISYPYSVRMNFQAQKHNAPLVALDFSEDSNYVQSASEDNELLYRGYQFLSNRESCFEVLGCCVTHARFTGRVH